MNTSPLKYETLTHHYNMNPNPRDTCKPPVCRYREIAFAQMEGDSKNALLANSQLEEELHMQVRVHIIFSVAETVH